MRNLIKSLSPNTQGIVCLVGAIALLTLSDSIIKWLSPDLPLHEITLFRSCFALVIVMLIVRLEGGLVTLKTRRPVLHFVRGSLLVLANMFFFIGLSAMPLAETVVLFYTAPLFICILSQPVLGERVGLSRWFVILVGLIGSIIMLRPGIDLFRPISLLPIMAAVSFAVMTMMTRKLGLQDKAGALTFYIQIAFIVISSITGLVIGDGSFDVYNNQPLNFSLRAWTWPSPMQLQLLIACGAIVAIGGYLMSQAYRLGEASAGAPFEYASLSFALAIGFYLWGDWPDAQAFVGTGLIIGSGIIVVYLEARTPKKPVSHAQIDY